MEWAFSPRFYMGVAALTLLGLYLVSRQWDAFMSSFGALMTLEGAALLLVAVTAVKILHELGHAFAATRFGCRVPTMGVAIVMLLPCFIPTSRGRGRCLGANACSSMRRVFSSN